jgi:hypothetical protein
VIKSEDVISKDFYSGAAFALKERRSGWIEGGINGYRI